MDPVAWALAIASVGIIIGVDCGAGMVETMLAQAALLTTEGIDPDQFNELCTSLGAEWDACTVIHLDPQMDG